MIAIEEVFSLINNLDARKAVRRLAPGRAVVVVDEALQVVAVQRFKEEPELREVDALMTSHPGCAYFYTHPGMYPLIESLQGKIGDCANAFAVDWGGPAGKTQHP
jgi:hypothetical protein